MSDGLLYLLQGFCPSPEVTSQCFEAVTIGPTSIRTGVGWVAETPGALFARRQVLETPSTCRLRDAALAAVEFDVLLRVASVLEAGAALSLRPPASRHR